MRFISPYQLRLLPLFVCLIALSSCSAQQVVTRTELHYLIPPADLIPECHEPAFLGSTYGDAVEHAVQLQGAFRECHVEIDTLNQWVKMHQTDDADSQQQDSQGTPKG